MNPETIKAIQDAFAPVAEKIGQGAQYGWVVVMQQQIVYAWVGVFFAVLSLILSWPAYVIWEAIRRDEESMTYHDHFASSLFAIFATILLGACFIAGAITAITHFLNPGYYALDFFIGLVKGK